MKKKQRKISKKRIKLSCTYRCETFTMFESKSTIYHFHYVMYNKTKLGGGRDHIVAKNNNKENQHITSHLMNNKNMLWKNNNEYVLFPVHHSIESCFFYLFVSICKMQIATYRNLYISMKLNLTIINMNVRSH